MDARVLVVLARPADMEVLGHGLDHAQLVTRPTFSLSEATTLLERWRPAVAVVDLDVCTDRFIDGLCRPRADRAAVIALTRRMDLRTRLAAFERGVDDVLTIPFPPEELAARTLAVVRRTLGGVSTPALVVGDLTIDILHRGVRVGATEVHLTPLEHRLLYLLVANAGRVVTREEILDTLWGVDFVAGSNVVDRHVRNLRSKLQEAARRPSPIVTVPRRGFRFVTTCEA